MENIVSVLPVAIFVALIVYLLCKAVFQAYFKAKEEYVERIATKLKGSQDGKVRE